MRFVAKTLFVFVLGLPAAILAALLTWPARTLGDVLLVRTSHGSEDVWAINRILGQAFVLATMSLLTAVALAVFVSPWAGLVALLGLPALFALHVLWRDWRHDAAAHVRTFLLLAGGGLRRDLQARRRAVSERIEAAVQRLRRSSRAASAS